MPRQDVSSRTRTEWRPARRDGYCSRCATPYSATERDEIRPDGEDGFIARCCDEED